MVINIIEGLAYAGVLFLLFILTFMASIENMRAYVTKFICFCIMLWHICSGLSLYTDIDVNTTPNLILQFAWLLFLFLDIDFYQYPNKSIGWVHKTYTVILLFTTFTLGVTYG